jgi:hypothetical protein
VNLMNIRTLAAALAGAALFGITAAPTLAQTSAPGAAPPSADAQATPAKPKPKPKAKTSPGTTIVAVAVTNLRNADLVQLQAAEPGTANWKKVLGAVKSGKQALAKLPQASDCHVDLHGTFADGQSMDASGIDVCAEKTLNLTD